MKRASAVTHQTARKRKRGKSLASLPDEGQQEESPDVNQCTSASTEPLPATSTALPTVGARTATPLQNIRATDGREDDPKEILGLAHLVLELPDAALPASLQHTKDDGLSEEEDDPGMEEEDEDEIEDEEEEEEEEGDEEEEECEDVERGLSSLTSPCGNQQQLMDRIINDSVSFSELAALMGGDADLCSSVDAAGRAADATPPPPAAAAAAAASAKSAVVETAAPSTLADDPVAAAEGPAVQQPGTQEQPKAKSVHSAADSFGEELDQQQRPQLRRGRGRSGRGRLHPALAALMGQANLNVVHGHTDEAIKMCLEIIRQFPNSPLPYETLAMIYEDRGLLNKSLQFQLIAAFLSAVPEKWIALAEYYKQQDELEQAVFCYSRAIKQSPSNLSYHWQRVELLDRLGHQARALKCYTYMLKFLKPDQAKGGLRLAKEIAKIHFSQLNYSSARQAMETAFLRCPDHVSYEDVNLLLDVLITDKDYNHSLEVLRTYAGVKLLPKEESEAEWSSLSLVQQLQQAAQCWLPDDLPIDLRSKLTVCLIMCQAITIAQPLVTMLMSESTEEFGDLYIDAVEAYLSVKQATAALPLLQRLLACPRHSAAATVWRLYAEALLGSGDNTDDAVQAYYKVVELAPGNASARLTLSSILLSQGLEEAALQALHQQHQPLDCQVLMRRCELLLERRRHNEFVKTASQLLGRHFVNIRSRDEAEVLINNKKASNKFESLRELRRSKGEPVEDAEPRYAGPEVPLLQQWTVFVKACRILHAEHRFAELERMTYSALGSREFMKEHLREVEFFCLQASMANNNSHFAFNLMRDIVVRHPHNYRVWNLLNQVIIKADDFRHNRFLLRLSQKHPEILAMSMLNGHNCLVAGTYKYSLAEYMKVFKGRQTDPLASLMLGLTYIHMACQKFSADKNTLVTQAWVFLNSYRELRGDCQESLYNIGRSMHQLNLLHQAIYYYELALQCPPHTGVREDEPSFDLTCEIAFNLSLLYRKGSSKLSRYYVRKYITV